MRHILHSGLFGIIKTCFGGAGVPDADIVPEARGLKAADRSRPGDMIVLDFFTYGRHLVIDAVVTIVYTNTVLQQVANIIGYAAPFGIGREALVCGTRTARGRCQMLPHLLVVGADISCDPSPARFR
jgi:hypothetical protein